LRTSKFGEVGGGCLRRHGIVDREVEGRVDFEVEK
jgi:hypothetical protein